MKEVLCDIAPWTLVIFFWDGHDFVLKHSILIVRPEKKIILKGNTGKKLMA